MASIKRGSATGLRSMRVPSGGLLDQTDLHYIIRDALQLP